MRRITRDIRLTIDGSLPGFRLTRLDAFSGVMLFRLLMRLACFPPEISPGTTIPFPLR